MDGKLCCSKCGEWKTPDDFATSSRAKCGRQSWCRTCQKLISTIYADTSRKNNYAKNFGITIEDYNKLYEQQGGRCKGCKRTLAETVRGKRKTAKFLSVDHCHKTGTVRGLLCTNCNTGLGMFEENPEFLRSMATYIEDHLRSA
jgi:hypothetical protein